VPLRRRVRARPLPGASSLRPDAARRRARSVLVVSHHLDGLLRARACGFVAPRCRSGVRRVSVDAEPVPSEDGGGPPCDLPATRVHTLRRVSLVGSRYHIAVARCPLAVTGLVRSPPRPKPMREPIPANREPRGPPSRPPPKGRRPGELAGTSQSPEHPEALVHPKADLHFSVARCGTGEPVPSRADRHHGATEATRAESGRSRVGRHAHPAPGARLRGRRPKASSPNRPAAETADDPGTLEPPKRHERTSRDLAKRPTAGPCSADESVVSSRRCRRCDTRSFHGLCSPPRSTRRPHQPDRMPGSGKRRAAEAARRSRRGIGG
jgi:hypothetical protein